LKKGKVKQGFIYENAQKKVLENFCPGKSLILLNKKVYEPCIYNGIGGVMVSVLAASVVDRWLEP
jgi:hypothetical protein